MMKYYPAYSSVSIIYYGHPVSLSSSKWGLAATTLNGHALFGGGGSRVDAYNELLVRSSVSTLSYPKWWLGTTTVGGYAIFGSGHEGSTDSTGHYIYRPQVDVYNTSLTKVNASNFSVARVRYGAVTIGNYALFGGGDYEIEDATVGTVYDNVDAYSSSLTKVNVTPLEWARSYFAATTVSNYALFGGGYNKQYRTARVEVYNNTLTKLSTIYLSVARLDLSATSINDYALFAGGTMSGITYVENTVDAFDKSLTHLLVEPLNQARKNLSATTLNGYGLFSGGYAKNSSNQQYCSTAIDAYDKNLTKIIPQALSEGRTLMAATSIGKYALFGGGYKGTTGVSTDVIDVYSTV